jgi:hypothetical protein
MPKDLVVISRQNYTLKLQNFSVNALMTLSDADGEIISSNTTFTYTPRFNDSGALIQYTCGMAEGNICIGSDNSFCVSLGAENRYVVNGKSDATIYTVADETYTFQMLGVNHSHPFLVSNSNLGGKRAKAWPTVTGKNPASRYQSFVMAFYYVDGGLYYGDASKEGKGSEISIAPNLDIPYLDAWNILYDTTGGDEAWTDCHSRYSPCTCAGILCFNGSITEIRIANGAGLKGKLPKDIGALDRLEVLVLTGGFLEGMLPESLTQMTGYTKNVNFERCNCYSLIP